MNLTPLFVHDHNILFKECMLTAKQCTNLFMFLDSMYCIFFKYTRAFFSLDNYLLVKLLKYFDTTVLKQMS